MGIKYYSQMPAKMNFYSSMVLIFIIIGFSTLIGPFVAKYFTSEKYDMSKLRRTDQELKENHVAIWQDLNLSWEQFWVRKINVRFHEFYDFPEKLSKRLYQEKSSSRWDTSQYLKFFNAFLQEAERPDGFNDQIYYYLTDKEGRIYQDTKEYQPPWLNLSELKSLDMRLYFNYDVAKTIKSWGLDSTLQYSVQLGITPDTMRAVLTFLFYDGAMEELNLDFVVSIEMGDIFEWARTFFDLFEQQIIYLGSKHNQLQTTLVTLDRSNEGAFYYRSYGNELLLDSYNLPSGKISPQRDVLYQEFADAILTVIQPSTSSVFTNPSLDFLLNASDKVTRGRRLDLDLQIRGYMEPFIASNIYSSLENAQNGPLALQIVSIGKIYLMPPSRNLVLLNSVVEQSWWDKSQFYNMEYRRILKNIIFLFIILVLIMLTPIIIYSFFMMQYAKGFFQISHYVRNLPTARTLIEKSEENQSVAEYLSSVSENPKDNLAENSIGEHVVEEVRQRFIKLLDSISYWREQSATDELTGLLNRKGLNQICSYEYNRMKRSGSSFCLILLDIDHFKNVNDEHGHDVGDLALKSLSKTLTSTFRMSDYLGRWGGEEFLIILPDTLLPGSIQVAESARSSVEKMIIQTETASLQLTISIGIASSSTDISFAETLNYADKCLYRAKLNGRNQVWAYNEGYGYFAVPTKQVSGRHKHD